MATPTDDPAHDLEEQGSHDPAFDLAQQDRERRTAPVEGEGGDSASAGLPPALDDTERVEMIAQAAYYLAQQRGFEPGHDLRDWFEAERTVDAQLSRRRT
jgi:hypothetical protein